MPGTELTVLENALAPLMPEFEEVLRGGPLRAKRVMTTLKWNLGRHPKLLECTLDSLVGCAMTAADLWLLPDGYLGQFFMLPFKNRKTGVTMAQSCIGYKGFTTLGAREGLTIDGDVVREGDEFDVVKGTKPEIIHRPKLNNKGRIVCAWAAALSNSRPAAIVVVGIDEILEIKARSPAVKFGAETPWTDEKIGFVAMAAKTPKRRLARALPIGAFVRAASMEDAFEERGLPSYTRAGQLMVDGAPYESERKQERIATSNETAAPLAPAQPPPALPLQLGVQTSKGRFPIIMGRGEKRRRAADTIDGWRANCELFIRGLKGDRDWTLEEKLGKFRDFMGPVFNDLRADFPKEVRAVAGMINQRLGKK